MQRHVANGGRPHDEFGEHIVKTSEDIAKLNSFSRYVSNKDQLNDNAGDIIEQTKLKLENLREYMRNLSKQKHYEAHCKSFRKAEDQILDDETVAAARNSLDDASAAILYKSQRTGAAGTTDTIYPTIGDQLDMLYKDMLAGKLDTTGTWATAIKATKDKYPKP